MCSINNRIVRTYIHLFLKVHNLTDVYGNLGRLKCIFMCDISVLEMAVRPLARDG